jgi:hypothetical protein
LAVGYWPLAKSQKPKAKHVAKVHFFEKQGIPKNGDFNYQKKCIFAP